MFTLSLLSLLNSKRGLEAYRHRADQSRLCLQPVYSLNYQISGVGMANLKMWLSVSQLKDALQLILQILFFFGELSVLIFWSSFRVRYIELKLHVSADLCRSSLYKKLIKVWSSQKQASSHRQHDANNGGSTTTTISQCLLADVTFWPEMILMHYGILLQQCGKPAMKAFSWIFMETFSVLQSSKCCFSDLYKTSISRRNRTSGACIEHSFPHSKEL